MRLHARVSLLALVVCGLMAVSVSAAQAEAGIESFFAANCKVDTCKKVPKAEEKEKAELEGFTQAGGHPNYGITDFTINTTKTGAPEGIVTHIRTDVAPGVSTNPEAVKRCSMSEFGTEVEPGFFLAPTCESGSIIGENKVVVYIEGLGDYPLSGTVYNLEQPKGLASDFGVALELPEFITKVKGIPIYAHTLIEGNVEWGAEAEGTGKADYHDYFNINVSTLLPLISSRLIFKGNIGKGGFLTNPTSCSGVGPQTTTTLHLKFEGGATAKSEYSPPIGTENCGLVPFEPGFHIEQGTKASDAPDGLTTEFTLQHNPDPAELDNSQVKAATITLPEGITMNPSAASGLEDCTPEQIAIGTKNPVTCPEGSRLGTVSLDVPDLPEGALQGYVYLGGPANGPITGGPNLNEPEYTIYVSAESEQYGVDVRLKGTVKPNPKTGQLTTTFTENPEQPFSKLVIRFNGGPLAPLANGVKCEASTASTTFVPFTNTAAVSPGASFEVTGCASTLPFSLSQSTANETNTAGAHTSFTFSLTRPSGQQYVEKVTTTLPEGLVGTIPDVAQCSEAQVAEKNCPQSSKIGVATVTAGAGSSPYTFSGSVYLTGRYEGAPYGLAIMVPAVAGPFDLETVVTRATLNINPSNTRVTVASTLPTIVKGVPLRLRSIGITINRQGFLDNPTNCSAEATETTLTSTFGTVQTAGLSTPFQVEGCSSLAFKPTFTASTSGKPSKALGASLVTTITQPAGQANIKSVVVTLPKQLPSRLTTLQKACLAATFEANPASCPAGSKVGTASAVTPVLPGTMTGPAYFVSHGGEKFPDLDLVLEGNNGVRVILVGNTNIKNGITTTTFAATPDVPVSSVTVNLPLASNSALAANGSLCAPTLIMPTTITAQNGKVFKQNTKITPTGCGVQIVGHKVIGNTAYLTVKTFAAGRVSGSGSGVSTTYRTLGAASNAATLKVSLSSNGRARRRPFKVKLRVGFVPKKGAHSNAYVTVTFR